MAQTSNNWYQLREERAKRDISMPKTIPTWSRPTPDGLPIDCSPLVYGASPSIPQVTKMPYDEVLVVPSVLSRILLQMYYQWYIEIYFKILKNGCKVEELQPERLTRLEPALSFYTKVPSQLRKCLKILMPLHAYTSAECLKLLEQAGTSVYMMVTTLP